MIQGGIEGGLDDAFRFETVRPTPLDSGFRRNDGSCAKVPFNERGDHRSPTLPSSRMGGGIRAGL